MISDRIKSKFIKLCENSLPPVIFIIMTMMLLLPPLNGNLSEASSVPVYTDPAIGVYGPDTDQLQGLHSLNERQGYKPWGLFRDEDEMLIHRTIFRDRRFGTYIWMIDDSPGNEGNTSASIYPAWNADASLMYLPGFRPGADGRRTRWFANADFSRLIINRTGTRPMWDRENPDVYFYTSGQQAFEFNVRKGEARTLASWDYTKMPVYRDWERHPDYDYDTPRESRIRIYMPEGVIYGTPWPAVCMRCGSYVWTPSHLPRANFYTADNRYIFLEVPHGGMWLSHDYEPYSQCRDRRHRSWLVETESFGGLIRVLAGILIDRETLETSKVIAPIDGDEQYLRTYMSGNVHFPSGGEWDEYRVHTSDAMEELLEIYKYYPAVTHGHWNMSPDREYLAMDGSFTDIYPARGGNPLRVKLSPDGGNYHLHWNKHPRFFVGWVRGWHFGNYTRPKNANIVFQVFSDGTAQPIVDTKHLVNSTYAGADFTMQSPDATKIHYGSNMTGRSKNYVALMARPRPPLNLTWSVQGSAVKLGWEPSAYARETRGYLVYRSDRSGDDYELLNREPVAGLSWLDTTVQRGKPYYYVVTSIENSGFESGYSVEAARVGVRLPRMIDAPLVVYAEAEDTIKDLYTDERPGLAVGADRWNASDWYYVYLHPEAEHGRANMQIQTPVAGTYNVWVRIRSESAKEAAWALEIENSTMSASTPSRDWVWVRAGRARLPEGNSSLTIATGDHAAQLDLVCLATDNAFVPEGPRPEISASPPPAGSLRAENIQERVNYLAWEEPKDAAISYYQVYASREPFSRVGQEFLIGSPNRPFFYDWGLKSGAKYYYAVTAVDSRGNESPAVRATVSTPEVKEAAIHLMFSDARQHGPFERSRAGATHGEFYLVPKDPGKNSVSWKIDVPHDGNYYAWLRSLQRGSGQRGNTVRHNIDMLVDGKKIFVLGGGATDLHVRDELITEGHPLANQLWTWVYPGRDELEPLELTAGAYTLSLKELSGDVRYDALVITSDPSWKPDDGRILQR